MSYPIDVDDIVLRRLESKEYIRSRSDTDNLENVRKEIIKFFTWFNEVARKSLLNCSKKDEYLFLLLELKKQIKCSISALGNSPNNRKQEFICGLCDEKIIVKPWQDIWECFQNHSHFDQLCLNFLGQSQEGKMDNTLNAEDKSNPREVVSDVTEKLDELFKHLDQLEVPIKTEKSSIEFNKSDKGVPHNIEVDDKSRQWYSQNVLKINEDSSNVSNSTSKSSSKIKMHVPSFTSIFLANSVDQYSDVNNFQFNFINKYDFIVEQNLYPKFYQKFNVDEDPIIQRSGYHRTVCLTCQCELRMQKSTHNILSHMSGQKHVRKLSNPRIIEAVHKYHDIFLNLEPNFQAQQVYFVPDDDLSLVKCVLCLLYVKTHDVFLHILNDPHKQKVINLRNEPNVKSTFSLLDYHLEVYGIKHEVKDIEGQKEGESNKHQKRIFMNGTRKDVIVKVHDIVKSVENPNDDNPLKSLPRRFAQHLKYLKNDGPKVICIACTKGGNIPKCEIKLHLIQPSHLESTKLTLLNYRYFCEICDMKFHDEMLWHMHFGKTPIKHQKMASSRKDHVCEYECLTCNVIIFGDTLSLSRHQNSFTRKIEKKKETVLCDDTKKYFSSKIAINENGQRLLEDAYKVLDAQENMIKCCKDMEVALLEHFPYCRAHPFGSRISGLGNSDSDLDVFIDIGNMYDGIQNQNEGNQIKIINMAIEMFRKNREFYKITSRPTARTPIIRLKHRPTGLDCDISFRHGLSVENTKFLRFCFQLQPISQKLILLLKKWSHLCLLNENITTYAFAMMTIFYLQIENYLVSVKTVKTLNPNRNVVIDGWETISYTAPIDEVRKYIRMYDGDIVELLKGFFKYYSKFDYKTYVICPLLGETVLKSQFTEDLTGGKLPKEMDSYKRKIKEEESPEYFRSLSEFCIQDPFDLSHNLTKACSSTFVEKFQKLCTLTHELLEKQ